MKPHDRAPQQKTVWVYILRSASTGQFYVGITTKLARRIREHNRNQSIGTKGKGPWRLTYRERHSSYQEARKREKILKTKKGRDQLRPRLES